MICRQASSWRLYSWMRLTWTTNIASAGSSTPVRRRTSVGEVALVRLLDRVQRVEEVLVVGERLQALQARQLGQIDPARTRCALESRRVRRGFACSTQRRGVTPLVLLLKRSGHSS